MSVARWIAPTLLLSALAATGGGLALWKYSSVQAAVAAAADQPEPVETVATAVARALQHRASTTAIGTVRALRSISLRNEVAGTVRQVALVPGDVVEAGSVLVALDVSVEQAELRAQEAQAALAQSMLDRTERMSQQRAVSQSDLERSRAERDVALAQIARTRAVIARKTLRAPFRARIGIADVHPGQFLEEGAELTTLQGVDDAAHVDFAVAQQVAAALRSGDTVEVYAGDEAKAVSARIVAIDARIDPATRNATVRARIDGAGQAPAPGASVRVRVPTAIERSAIAIPASALRKGPGGDHVFVLATDAQGQTRAQQRLIQVTAQLGEEVVIESGLAAGEKIAAAGSFKLRDAALVAVAEAPAGAAKSQ
ncbi:membrane fusion protein (multidrug efflux system) [Tahibacter aquaticus]|uniref:Membrane fusion protein (Multidrug efflux system) n=1 Tax=Tahibacter aquaticus TaxID=520092 RepID=A0A4V3DMJ4_9GAMM|nr:efflux RND transporter periplasmic adaptor subunit [Tahibacter aquaticus]TDR44876.1 membrane fusion protein (multidrug efflux system) [Tahibacter aquaticus]